MAIHEWDRELIIEMALDMRDVPNLSIFTGYNVLDDKGYSPADIKKYLPTALEILQKSRDESGWRPAGKLSLIRSGFGA